MVDIKKLKKIMIDKEVSNTELKLVLGVSSQGLHNKLHYINAFTAEQIGMLSEYLKVKYEEFMHDSVEEYLLEVEEARK